MADRELNDTAMALLTQGKVAEAQALLQQLSLVRMEQLQAQAEQCLEPSGSVVGQADQPRADGAQPQDETSDTSDWESKDWTGPKRLGSPPPTQPSSEVTDAAVQAAAFGTHSKDWGPFSEKGHRDRATALQAFTPTEQHRRSRSSQQTPATPTERQGSDTPDQGTPGVQWEGGFEHCVEVHSLTKDTRTSHLQEFLDVVLPGCKLQPSIQWSDDNHAVFVCKNVSTALELIGYGEAAGYQIRPWSQASEASKRLPVGDLLPPKPRPKSTAAVAKKFLAHALNRPELRDRASEQILSQARKEARDARRTAREQTPNVQSAWDDDV